jgi:hypothetical protein
LNGVGIFERYGGGLYQGQLAALLRCAGGGKPDED